MSQKPVIARPTGLTALFVANIKEPGKYHDGRGNGLFLRIDPKGRKQWVQRITFGSKRREIGLGSCPTVTLAMARDEALENKRRVRQGLDPLAEKRKSQKAMTFSDAMERYLEVKLKEFRNEKHRKQWRSSLDAYAIPKLRNVPLDEITMQHVQKVLEPIWLEKTETAQRLRGRIEKILDWATVTEQREGENPARYKGNLSEVLPKPARITKTKHHPALSIKGAPTWWGALRSRTGIAAMALRFACLTAARSGEVRGMTWDEVDLDEALWIIPAERMKGQREHRVPLPDAAVQILREVPRIEGSDFVFPAPRGGKLSDMTLSAVMRRMQDNEEAEGRPGYRDEQSGRPAVPHGLRSTFRDWAAERGYDHIQAELALAHTVGTNVERAYRRTDLLIKRRQMLEDWSDFLENRGAASSTQ